VLLRYLCTPSTSLFVKNFHNIVDVVAAVPPLVLRVVTHSLFSIHEDASLPQTFLLCVVPVLRALKMLRRFQQYHLFIILFQTVFEALCLLLFTLFILVLTFSCLVYVVEPRDNVESLSKAMWLTIVTVSTVGYGDVTPKSSAGTLVMAILVICSVLYMAMPIGIIGNEFTHIWEDRDRILLMIRTRERLLQWGYTARDMARVFRRFDESSDGLLHIHEFRRMMNEMQVGLSPERIVELFDSIDKDGSGSIDVKEFLHSLFPSEYCDIYGALGREELKGSSRGGEDRGATSPRRATSPAAARGLSRNWTVHTDSSDLAADLRLEGVEIPGFGMRSISGSTEPGSSSQARPAGPKAPAVLALQTKPSAPLAAELDCSILPSSVSAKPL